MRPAINLDLPCDGVGCGASHIRDYGTLRAEQPVEERALAHVGPPHDRKPRQPVFFTPRSRLREQRDYDVEKVADS